MKTTVSKFWLQPTFSFPDGAPQREEYDGDELFKSVCLKYEIEWRAEYICNDKNCKNRDCPQHFSE